MRDSRNSDWTEIADNVSGVKCPPLKWKVEWSLQSH